MAGTDSMRAVNDAGSESSTRCIRSAALRSQNLPYAAKASSTTAAAATWTSTHSTPMCLLEASS